MCFYYEANIECRDCHDLIEFRCRVPTKYELCQEAINKSLEWGRCGTQTAKPHPNVMSRRACRVCEGEAKEQGSDRYTNWPEYKRQADEADRERAAKRQREKERAQYLQQNVYEATELVDQAGLLSGAGAGMSADQGGYTHTGSATYSSIGAEFGDIPQDLEMDLMDDEPQQTYEDYGEGSSHGHSEGYGGGYR
ncbi:hypothetical protein J7T55_005589 [Diaporthe amygdali]|uniref:uncharacterized protein n=1 Tax=Phomopsis amygdali TaxID=1214568 RepID=UPI0022FEFFE2|nr:uncharacterized protein J7T55_005589 [Diaporthe amygdali]KAJ0124251.1 hypothetical protein J7T55_005589 [Diaporthe amygdali]